MDILTQILTALSQAPGLPTWLTFAAVGFLAFLKWKQLKNPPAPVVPPAPGPSPVPVGPLPSLPGLPAFPSSVGHGEVIAWFLQLLMEKHGASSPEQALAKELAVRQAATPPTK